MRCLRPAAAALVAAAAAAPALAADRRVPGDFPDVKSALLAAEPGDRVLVSGGRWRNGRITRGDVALVGDGAVLTGVWEITGSGSSIEGCAFRDFHLSVAADRVTLRGNSFSAPRYFAGVEAQGAGDFVFEGNRVKRIAVSAVGSTNAVARGNRLAGGEISLYGAAPLVEDNVCTRSAQVSVFDGAGAVVRRNRTPNVFAWGVTGASIQDNTILGGTIDVRGDSAGVEANRMAGSASIHVEGGSALVRANTGTLGRGGIFVAGAAPVVTDNVVSRRAPVARCDCPVLLVSGTSPGSVAGNDVTHVGAEGIRVLGRGHEVSDNVVRGRFCLDSLRVEGDSSSIRRNVVEQTGGRHGFGSGIVLLGDSGAVADNVVVGALYDGISVTGTGDVLSSNEVRDAGRCGLVVFAGSDLALVDDCTVSGAGWSAVLNAGDRTTFSGGSYRGGIKVDVLDLGGATQFADAVFATKSADPALAPFR